MSRPHQSLSAAMEILHARIASLVRDARRAAIASGAGVSPAGRGDPWLEALDRLLRLHLGHEETLLLPHYEAHQSLAPPAGSREHIERDHRRIEALLDEASVVSGLRRQEALSRLDDALQHHDQREALGLAPVIDEVLPTDLRTTIVRRMLEEAAALPATPPVPAPAAARPCADPGVSDPPEAAAARVAWAGNALRMAREALATGQDAGPAFAAFALRLDLADAAVSDTLAGADPRYAALVAGQQSKLRALLDRIHGCPDPLAAFDVARTLAGLLENHRGHVAARTEA